jgi:hypothetical protein
LGFGSLLLPPTRHLLTAFALVSVLLAPCAAAIAWTLGVRRPRHSGAILALRRFFDSDSTSRATRSQMVNGMSTIFALAFIDPRPCLMTDEVGHRLSLRCNCDSVILGPPMMPRALPRERPATCKLTDSDRL